MNQPVRPLIFDRSTRTTRRFHPDAVALAALAVELARDAWRFGRWSARLAMVLAVACFLIGACVVSAGLALAVIAVGQR